MFDRIKYRANKRKFINYYKGNNCKINKSITLREQSFICLGRDVVLGEGAKLLCWPKYTSGKELQLLAPDLQIGNNVHATRNLTIQCAGRILIEDNVLIGSNVFIIDYNHGMNPQTESYLDNRLEVSEVRICKGTWIGNDVIILPGVTIGEKAIIGAGSVVTKSIPDFCIAAGNPARIIKAWDKRSKEWIAYEHNHS